MKNSLRRDGRVKDSEIVASGPKVFANLTYDHGFKIVFGTEGKSEKLLMTLLNRLLGMNIVSVKYLPTERLGLTEEESKEITTMFEEKPFNLIGDDKQLTIEDFQPAGEETPFDN